MVIWYTNLGVLVCLMVLCDDLRMCRIDLIGLSILKGGWILASCFENQFYKRFTL